jgi:hypothetical protein
MATNQILQSAKSSYVLQQFAKAGYQDLSYQMPQAYPDLAKEMINLQPLQPVTGSLYGATVRFELPQMNLLRWLVLDTIITYTASTPDLTTAITAKPLGLIYPESFEFRTRSESLAFFPGSYIRSRTMVQNVGKVLADTRRAMLLDETTGAVSGAILEGATGTVRTFTPLFNAFFESVENHVNLAYFEPIQVVVNYRTAADVGNARGISGALPTLWMSLYQPSDKFYRELTAKNFGGEGSSDPYLMLSYAVHEEVTVCTGRFANTAKIRVNSPVFNTYVDIVSNIVTGESDKRAIQTVGFKIAGRNLYESIPNLIATYEQEMQGHPSLEMSSATAVTRPVVSPIVLGWGLEVGQRLYNSGAISYNNLNVPEVSMTHADLGSGTIANFDMVLNHEYWTLTQFNPNGSIQVSNAT